MLDTWPHTHLAGSLGQVGSTSNLGIMRGAGAASEDSTPLWRNAIVATNVSSRTRVMRFMEGLPFVGRSIAPMEVGAKLDPDAPPFRHFVPPSPSRGEGKRSRAGEGETVLLFARHV